VPTCAINGHSLYYELHGSADDPPLVLLHHGLGASSEWAPQIARFVDQHYRVIAYDRWGYGRSDPREAFAFGYLLHDTQEAIALLDALQVRAAYILGHSDGGTIALLLASQRPDLVRAMVIEAAHIYYEPKIQAGIRAMLDKVQHSRVVRAYLAELHGDRGRALAEQWLAHWLTPDNLPTALVEPGALSRVRCPVLVVQGQDDEYATDQHALDIAAALPDSQLWLVPACGHTPHAALGDQFNERVIAFFARVAPPEGESVV
jgi:pimeloyl-ACP methyl ester carboxylesterase